MTRIEIAELSADGSGSFRVRVSLLSVPLPAGLAPRLSQADTPLV
jgi:hypothetical protein